MADEIKERAPAVDQGQATEGASAADSTIKATPNAEKPKKGEPPGVKGAQFSTLEEKASEGVPGNLDFILDIPLEVSVQLGRSKMLIRDLLQLGQGAVVELEKMAGEPLDVYIGDKLIARGEVVVINEKFGIRLTDIVSPIERIKELSK